MKKNRESKVKKLMEMRSQNSGRKEDVNCPFASDCDRISRAKFLKVMGVGVAAIGATAVGLGSVAKAQIAPTPPTTSPPPVWYIGADRTTLGNWFNEVPGDNYGNCAWILGAMNAVPVHQELPVPHDNDYKFYDVYGGRLMQPDCGLDYKVYTCKTTTPSNCERRFLEDRNTQYRRSTCWFTDGSNGQNYMTIILDGTKIPINAGKYELALYFLDSDGNNSRAQDVTVTQGPNSAPTQSISNFSNGIYLAFGIEGGTDVEIKITNTGPSNAVISGIFINPCGVGTSCTVEGTCPTYMGIDPGNIQGDWVDYNPVPADVPNWGKFWYLLCSWDYPNNVSSDPSILKSVSGAGTWAWTPQCTQTQSTPGVCNILESEKQKASSFAWSWGPDTTGNGLLIPPEPWEDYVVYPVPKPSHLGTGAWASCYDDGGENFPPGQGPDLYVDLVLPAAGGCSETSCYQVSFYATDYDSTCRRQNIEIYDPITGQLLATSNMAPGNDVVGPGVYHTFFMPAGNYLVKVDYVGCTNAILSGIFVNCVECPKGTGDMRTIGYWKHQFAVACGKNKGKAQVTPATLTAYLAAIGGKSTLFSGLTKCGESPTTSAYKILWPNEPAPMCTRARQQLLALYLNWAAGAVNWNEMVYNVYTGTYVQYNLLVADLATLILSGNKTQCEVAKTIADWLNNSGYE